MTISSISAIEVEAFKGFVAPTVLRIANLPAGLHLVCGRNLTNDRLGSNGSGKSTFFSDAVTWCLYGRTVGGLRTTEIQSWLTKEPPRVAVALRQDKQEHVIVRGPKASALTIGGRTVGQEDVDALVGLDYMAWCQAVIWGQGMPLFFDLAPAAKMGLLSDALGLERWEQRAQAAGARSRRLDDRLRGVEGEVRGLEAAQEHAQDALEKAKDTSDVWVARRAAIVEETASAVRSARLRVDSLEERRGEAALAADSAGTAAKLLRPDVEAARAACARLQAEARTAEVLTGTAVGGLKRAEGDLAAFAERGACPTCGQPVAKMDAERHSDEIRARIAHLQKQIKSRAAGRGIAARARVFEERLHRDEPRLRELEEAERRADGDLRVLEHELATARAHAAAAQAELARVETEVNPHQQAAQEARAHLRAVKKELLEKEDLVQKLAASVERAQFWARGFRDIRLGVIDDIIRDLRETTAEVMDGLGLGDWTVEYTTERETKAGIVQSALTVVVRSPSAPAGVRWGAYSGGERQRLRLAGALALSEVLLAHAGAALDFRVMDEPTRGLSREGVQDLVELLRAYAEEAGLKIFYVDHSSEEGAVFTSTATVINAAGGARLE